MTTSLFERVQGIAADVFDVPRRRIAPDTSPEQLPVWDSVRHLSLVLALEAHFGLCFDPEEVGRMTTVGRIAELVAAKLGDPAPR